MSNKGNISDAYNEKTALNSINATNNILNHESTLSFAAFNEKVVNNPTILSIVNKESSVSSNIQNKNISKNHNVKSSLTFRAVPTSPEKEAIIREIQRLKEKLKGKLS